jgi:tRNA-specific 2-thiouridylase
MTDPIAIAVSGGIDSLVAAYLLKQQGHPLQGIHFLTGYEKEGENSPTTARKLCRKLDIPLTVVDLKAAFNEQVVAYFASAYANGETPNPCLVCNPSIKFGVLLEKARQLGAGRLATGHYARVKKDPGGRFRLFKGEDARKDQSYFLSRLTRDQLARACLPLGAWTKDRVRALAAEKNLGPLGRSESQDICFIQNADYAAFLEKTAGIVPRSGEIVDTAGRSIGTHNGLHRYTVGQRRGLNCPASGAYYVIRIDARRNQLVVGFEDERDVNGCRVRDINWIAKAPDGPLAVEARIRYRHKAVAATIIPDARGDGAMVRFDQPQASVAPGQGAVFYLGDEVIGGGWIV